MLTFTYKARDFKNITRSGMIEAPDLKSAATTLRSHGLFPLFLEAKKETLPIITSRLGRIPFSEVVNFTRQLATMINAGLTLPEALTLLGNQIGNKRLAAIINEVTRLVEGGQPLASALAAHPAVFSPIYIALVRAGETAGVLDDVLLRLADNMEKEREFRSKIKGALVYPAIIVVAMIGVMFIMLIFVIPKLTDLYAGFGTELPAPTRLLIFLSDFLVSFWWLVIGLVVVGLMVAGRFLKTSKGRRFRDETILKIPVWGKLKKNATLAEFTRTLGLLVGAGIPIIEALKSVAAALDNVFYEEALDSAASGVEKGFPLAQSLAQPAVFPPLISQMVKTGEETGKLDEVLTKVSHYFESESEHGVKNLTTAIEPMILILLAFGVAFLIISVILPIYNLTSQF